MYSPIFGFSPNHYQPTRLAPSIEFSPQILYQPPNYSASCGWKSASLSKVSKKTFNWRKGFFLLQFKYKRGQRFRGFVCRASIVSEGSLVIGDNPLHGGVHFLFCQRIFCRPNEVLSTSIDYSTPESRLARSIIAFNVMDNIIAKVILASSDSSLFFCYKRGDQVTSWLTPSSILLFLLIMC